MRFDLVDLQLFIAVAEARSITGGADRVHLALASASARIKGLEAALGTALLKRGRRGIELTAAGESLLDHARIILHNVEAMRGDLAAYRRRHEGDRPPAHQHVGPVGISAEGAGGLPWPASAHLHRRRGARKRRHRAGHRRPAPPTSDLRPSMRCRTASSGLPSARIAWCWSPRAADELAKRRQVDFREVVGRDFVGLTTASALHAHIAGHAARLGARLRFRARLNNFHSIGQMVAAGIGIAVMPEVAARRCARSMRIGMVRIRDPWANRKLVICARSFKALPKPAQQLVEHLRKAAQ